MIDEKVKRELSKKYKEMKNDLWEKEEERNLMETLIIIQNNT